LAAAGEAQVVQIGSNSTTLTPNLPDELVAAFLSEDRDTITAILDQAGPPFNSSLSYGASKTAITRWCRRNAITDDWAGQGIRLNVIAPGAVQTPLLKGGGSDAVIRTDDWPRTFTF
jgi:NAD(P)-dependent dehydrogenase (short-subunit alcohol dehydrogenase family)